MSSQVKIGSLLAVSLIANVGLLFLLLQPAKKPTPDRTLQHALVQKQKEIEFYKKRIINADIEIKKLNAQRDSIEQLRVLSGRELERRNDAVYEIHTDHLNDTVKSILQGI